MKSFLKKFLFIVFCLLFYFILIGESESENGILNRYKIDCRQNVCHVTSTNYFRGVFNSVTFDRTDPDILTKRHSESRYYFALKTSETPEHQNASPAEQRLPFEFYFQKNADLFLLHLRSRTDRFSYWQLQVEIVHGLIFLSIIAVLLFYAKKYERSPEPR